MDQVPFTPEGYQSLMEELKRLKEVERPRISLEIGVAREHGDLKENAEWHAAREKQGIVEARIRDLEDKLSRAQVIDSTSMSGSVVRFGARVKLEDVESGKQISYRIVGPEEANIDQGSISIWSPVAKALIGREVGDEVNVQVPGGKRTYELLDVIWG